MSGHDDSDTIMLDDFDDFDDLEQLGSDDDAAAAAGRPLVVSHSYLQASSTLSARVLRLLPPRWRRTFLGRRGKSSAQNQRRRCASSPPSRVSRAVRWLLWTAPWLVVVIALFWPSYTHRPSHYNALRSLAIGSRTPGRANPRNETVFIAANIYDPDGDLAQSQWSRNIFQLIDLLGPENTFLSIYENDMDEKARDALGRMAEQTPCNHSLVAEEHLDTSGLLHVTLPDGSRRLKRIAFLAELRNRALRPINEPGMARFDRILYVNDVFFDPVDALQLLLSTNIGQDGTPQYRAACALDFINPFKFYDTFASRDLEGYSMGIPFFPWFTTAGKGQSRKDVLNQRDAVRVRSCWGGMVAFDARYFQASFTPLHNETSRFRAEPDLLWEASECCLIHADIQGPPSETQAGEPDDTGIYVNPYIRVAYSPFTLSWLAFTRRFERLYSIPHDLVNRLVGLPWFNHRRTERPGDVVEELAWVEDARGQGSYKTVSRTAGTGGFCGSRALQVMKLHPKAGEKQWERISPDSF